MGDDKSGRDEQAHDRERRQRERDLAEELERRDEPEPPISEADADGIDRVIEPVSFPATGEEVVTTVGETALELGSEQYTVAELVPTTERVRYRSAEELRVELRRPTVARATRRILEAADTIQDVEFGRTKRAAYERTLQALADRVADDDDEGVTVVTDWILERIDEDGAMPASRRVRRRAAEFCRANDLPVRDDEWLGA